MGRLVTFNWAWVEPFHSWYCLISGSFLRRYGSLRAKRLAGYRSYNFLEWSKLENDFAMQRCFHHRDFASSCLLEYTHSGPGPYRVLLAIVRHSFSE